MRPISLRIENVGRFRHEELTFADGCTALVGANGAGKSTLLNSIELALFANGSLDLAGRLSPWAERLEIELVFEHDGCRYRARRGFRVTASGGKSTLDLEWWEDDQPPLPSWVSLSKENTKETQALISETLGLSRPTFRASAFLAQGDAGNFAEADPADRKAILGAILDPRGIYPKLHEWTRAQTRTVEQQLAVAETQVREREQRIATLPDVQKEIIVHYVASVEQADEVREADTALEQAQAALAENAAAAERVARLRSERDHAKAEHERAQEALRRARDAAERWPVMQAHVESLRASAGRVAELERQADEARDAQAVRTESQRLHREVTDLCIEQSRLGAQHAHLVAAEDGQERCDRCQQILGADAREAAIASLRAEIERLHVVIGEKNRERAAFVIPDVPAFDATALSNARTDRDRLPAAEHEAQVLAEQAERVQAFAEEEAACHELRDRAYDAWAAAIEGAQDEQELRQAVVTAREAVTARRSTLGATTAKLVRARQTLEQLQTAEQEIAELVTLNRDFMSRLDLLRLAERCYGRDGVPVLVAENAIPAIEAEANRVLELMPTAKGETLRVELHTQAAKRDGDLRETLDVIVRDRFGQRPYEIYSGGEKGRLNFALRLALSLLLTNRRGAECRLLVLDELPYFDPLGREQLVAVLQSLQASYDVILTVDHGGMADAFDSVIVLETDEATGVSRVASGAAVQAVAA